MLKEAVLVCLMAASLAAQAQVFKCTNPHTGAITFSDRRCDTAERETHVLNKLDPRQLAIQQRETQAALVRLARDKAEIAANEARERSVAMGGGSYGGGSSWECRNAHGNAATAATSLTINKKGSQQAYMESLQAADQKCGGGESYATAVQRQKMDEAVRPKIPTPVPPPPPPPPPVDSRRTLRQCNLGICQDDQGEKYRFTGPQQLTNTWTGKTCTIDKLSGICK